MSDLRHLQVFVDEHEIGTAKQREKLAAVLATGSTRKAGQALGTSGAAVDSAVARLRVHAEKAGYTTGIGVEDVKVRDVGGCRDVRILSHQPKTEAEIMAEAELSPDMWRIKSHRKWTTSMKLKRDSGDEVVSVWNYHYVFERFVPAGIHDAIQRIFKDWKPPKPKTARGKRDGVMVELCLYDAHFGKLCWDEATDGKNYDLNTAASDYGRAIDTLIDRVSSHQVEKWLLPVGNDFFQTDNWQGTTTRGTPVANDDRISKVFRAGFAALEYSISRLLTVAPVEAVWVPGNHDLNTSWHLFHSLAQRYRNTKQVAIDLSHCRKRQYIEWGDCVIGLQHGDRMKPERMVMIAATEFDEWSRKRFREIHCGHQHTRRDYSFLSASEHAGTMVRYLAALSGTDEWHWDQGFVSNKRAAEAIVWDRAEGPIATALAFVE